MVNFNPSIGYYTSLRSGTQNQFTASEKRTPQPIQAETPAKKKEGSKNSWLLPTLAITTLAGLVTFWQRKNIGKAFDDFKAKRDLPIFKELQETAKKEFGLQSVIFRDNVQTARDVMTVLRDLKQRGYDLSDISIIVSEKAAKKNDRLVLRMKKGDTPEIINENFQALKHLLPANVHGTTQPELQKTLLKTLMVGGFVHPTAVGKAQKPLLILNPNYKLLDKATLSTDDPLHILYHELGHILHYKNLFKSPPIDKKVRGIQRHHNIQKSFTKIEQTASTPYLKSQADLDHINKLLNEEVSQFGGTRLVEFVPEYFVKQLLNPSYKNTELDSLYASMKGPEILHKKQ